MALQILDIFRLLDKSNCGECGLPTCMAFAQAVHSSERPATDCPRLPDGAAQSLGPRMDGPRRPEGFAASIEALRDRVGATDLQAAAARLGADYSDGTLKVSMLGKEFTVDAEGRVSSMLHVNTWILHLLLSYVSAPATRAPEGRWVPFTELSRGQTTAAYFSRRCEEPLRVIADGHTEVFFELLGIFGGKKAEGFDADFAVALHPLPRVPMLVLYWRAEEDFPSKLRVMFDPSADSWLGPETITGMGRGIVEMLQRIIPKHEEGTLDIQYL